MPSFFDSSKFLENSLVLLLFDISIGFITLIASLYFSIGPIFLMILQLLCCSKNENVDKVSVSGQIN